MPEFPIPSARILLVSQIQGGQLPPCPPVRYAYDDLYLHVICWVWAKYISSSSSSTYTKRVIMIMTDSPAYIHTLLAVDFPTASALATEWGPQLTVEPGTVISTVD